MTDLACVQFATGLNGTTQVIRKLPARKRCWRIWKI